MRRLRGAIAGFGKVVTEAHLPGFEAARGFDLLAVADPSPEGREAARARLPQARVYESLSELLAGEPKLEFVDVAAPPRLHAALVVEALERNLHVLCEKPLVVSAAEMNEVRRAAGRARRSVFTVHNWKYAPLFRRLRGLVVAGTVGELADLEWSILRPNPPAGAVRGSESWRLDPELAGGGILVDHGWHAFYLMLYLTGQAPRAVSAELRDERGLAVEDAAECTISFATCRARIRLSWNAAERKSFGVLRGTLGSIEIDDAALVVRVEGRPEEITRFSPPLSASSWHPEWFPPLLEDFRSEIQQPERRGRNLAEAGWCVDLLGAAYASKGETIRLGWPDDAEVES